MDAFRALAAAAVVISHARNVLLTDYAGQHLLAPFYFVTGFGHEAVILFFVLSGYWIAGSVHKRAADDDFWPHYLLDRLVRLYLVLLPALLMGAALDFTGAVLLRLPIYDGGLGAVSLTGQVAERLTGEIFLLNLAFLQSLAGPALGSNAPLWSLAYEFWFYLWFPALYLSVRRKTLSPALVSLAAAIVFPELLFGFVAWLMGAALHLVSADQRRGAAGGFLGSRLHLIASGLVLLGALALARAAGANWTDPLIAAAFTFFLLALLRSPRLRAPWRPLAGYGARASYSLYAIHFPLVALLAGLLVGPARLQPDAAGIGWVGAVTLVAILFGWAFAQATERHTRRVRAALWSRPRSAGSAT